jgi:hypothetical protein
MNVREFILEATAHLIIMFRLVHMSLSTLVFLNVACTVAKQSERSSLHDRNTRNKKKLNIPAYRSATGQRTFEYRACSIPVEFFT